MKIVVPYRFGIGENALAVLRKAGEVVLLDTDSDAVLRKELQDAATVLVSVAPKVTRELIAAAPCLRHIARVGVGVDIGVALKIPGAVIRGHHEQQQG